VARKPTMSPSRMTTYLACPVKYRWTYIDPRGRWYLKSRSYYSFGSSLHKVLERFHDEGDVGVTTVAQAVAAVEESWIDAGYGSAEEMAEAMGEGREMVERYVEEVISQEKEGKTIFVEKSLSMEFDRFRLLGRVDRIDELPDGTLEIFDYKTGRSTVDESELDGDIALGCYQLLLKQLYPMSPVKATIIALRSGARGSTSLSDDALVAFQRDIEALGNEILDTEFEELVPVGKPLCIGCDFIALCKKHPEFVPPTAG
jgi:putative RecB family exonuclease